MSSYLLHLNLAGSSEARWGIQSGEKIRLLPATFSLHKWLSSTQGNVSQAIKTLMQDAADEVRSDYKLLAPIDNQEVWAAGVTYERSREARQEESADGGDIYARVYKAERPEIFFKSQGYKVVGPLEYVGIREDATWSVPEPELAVLFNPGMEVVGFIIGNDMSSRDIEGANPLYLPQAKVYKASCALGPRILLQPQAHWPETTIHVAISRNGDTLFQDAVHTNRIKRSLQELGAYLGRSHDFPNGVVLLTGTGIVPPNDFTLAGGDVVTISIDGIGTLTNTVKVV